MGSVRCFFCLPLSLELEKELAAWIDANRAEAGQLRWVSRANLHITLRFCGEIPTAQAKDLSARVKRLLVEAPAAPFTLNLRGLGVYGAPPRVLWAGLGGNLGALGKVHELIERACRDAGVAEDTKKFSPHITLARMNAVRTKDFGGLERLAPWKLNGLAWRAGTVVFMRSHLTESGPRYYPMAKYALEAGTES